VSFGVIGGIVALVFLTIIATRDLRGLFFNDFLLTFVGLVVIVVTVSMFGLTGIFEARDLTTLFGAITGYILGQGANRRYAGPPPESSSSN
jgi:hypothetical protein